MTKICCFISVFIKRLLSIIPLLQRDLGENLWSENSARCSCGDVSIVCAFGFNIRWFVGTTVTIGGFVTDKCLLTNGLECDPSSLEGDERVEDVSRLCLAENKRHSKRKRWRGREIDWKRHRKKKETKLRSIPLHRSKPWSFNWKTRPIFGFNVFSRFF